jgi:hypothetical protein
MLHLRHTKRRTAFYRLVDVGMVDELDEDKEL